MRVLGNKSCRLSDRCIRTDSVLRLIVGEISLGEILPRRGCREAGLDELLEMDCAEGLCDETTTSK